MNQDKSVTPEEAKNLMQSGFVYIDVRNQVEFEQGHPAGSYNVPLILQTDFGPESNDAFVEIMKQHFSLDTKLVIGCGTGSRSAKAVRMLTDAGYANLVEQKAGFDGARDPFGRKSPGWRELGLPVETGQSEGRSYEALSAEV
jgi:rhodanese-related sulfurtransferase